MRRALLLTALALPSLFTLPAYADDEPAKAAVAPFALSDIVPADDARPEGWHAVAASDVVPAAAPTVGRLLALAKAAGVEVSHFDARCLPLQQGEGENRTGALAGWLSVDVDRPAFAKALAEEAKKHSWVIRPLGSAHRMAVSWAGDEQARKAITDWQAEIAVRKLCDLAFATMAGAVDREGYQGGMMQLASAQRIAPQSGPVLYMQGRVLASSRQAQRALGAWRAALAKDLTIKLSDRWTVVAAFQVGQAMLTAGQDDLLSEAVEVLKAGVAAEEASEEHFMRFGNRYNLACAYARLGKKDEAFAELDASLQFLRSTWQRLTKEGADVSQVDFPMNLEHARSKDPDMESLRGDERWAKLMAKYTPTPEKPAASKKDG